MLSAPKCSNKWMTMTLKWVSLTDFNKVKLLLIICELCEKLAICAMVKFSPKCRLKFSIHVLWKLWALSSYVEMIISQSFIANDNSLSCPLIPDSNDLTNNWANRFHLWVPS